MSHCTRFFSILALSALIPLAYAHDPKEHTKESAAATGNPAGTPGEPHDHGSH